MKLVVTLERDETGMLVAKCPAIPGCVSARHTLRRAGFTELYGLNPVV